jgi:hypothetical protein
MRLYNIPEFAMYCQEQVDNPFFEEAVTTAFVWANAVELRDLSEGSRYGHEVTMQDIDDVYSNDDLEPKPDIENPNFSTTAEILSRFWGHKGLFRKWLTTKVEVTPLQ